MSIHNIMLLLLLTVFISPLKCSRDYYRGTAFEFLKTYGNYYKLFGKYYGVITIVVVLLLS